ncbi:cytochrome P450 9e2-like [Leptopilina boulardi]|uniref:cytochrome P450 9e2-like n=1 Tax=Leptopilina boulardi TaxID=63433 RepID=UPI0021F576DB|nr:cytochrome P450 9e2-like [Leptopilina boulardi]
MISNVILILLSIIIVKLVSDIFKIIKKQTYFKTNGIPHDAAIPIFGNMLSVITRKKNIGDIVKKLYNTHKNAKYFGFYDFTNPVIVIRDIELVKSIAVKNFESFPDHGLLGPEPRDQLFARNLFNLKGERWHDVRTLLSPAFTSSKMKILYKLISDSTINFVECLLQDEKGNKMREMKEVFTRCTNDVIATCAFGININTMENPKNDFYLLGKEATNFESMTLKIFLMREFPLIAKIFNAKLLRTEVNNFFNETIRTTIKMRDTMGTTRPDMLQLLMDTRGKDKKVDLTPEEITAQAFVFYFAGFDTISTTMSFVAYELAINPDVQLRLQDEIDTVLRDSNGEPSFETIKGMEYLDAVLNETMRKYPVFAALDRVCSREFNLPPAVPDAKSIVVKPGMVIWIPVIGYHYDPLYYEEPEKFNPDRFLKNGTASNKATTFMSFGIGPRQCIGNRFALMEIKTVFFHLLARCNIRVCSKTNVPLELSKKSIGFAAKDGYWVKLEKRDKNFL